ncbi:NAD(P)/FAD-dependent oxidoreductase [Alicyclobacillus sp. ALC3]|uniref:NAD(P)/FAD-dependent oxidoreductase n=1 Tax=Alicyclobacillus sp. ALC3 TaxID=2796143 RepID=UPI002379BD9B|nr:FAD-dependent oxidoreductase [Alicyclobacillus sp. ALC3]WDL98546.1 FAD-binding oxidoreductase [Alicyclobacillus sp. ALC3]
MSFKVIVVGGGIIGTSTAYYLSKLGADVVLIESKDIAAGTSGSCDRAVMIQSKTPGPTLDLAIAGAKMYETLEDELGFDIEYRMGGGMILIETAKELDVVTQLVQKQQSAGLDVKLLSGDEARVRQPGLSPEILGATWWDKDAEVNPLHVSLAFARAAKMRGVEIRLHTTVTTLITDNGKVTGVQTELGEKIYADSVIVALGVWTPILLRKLALEVPIIPRRGQILVSEQIPNFIKCNILSGSYISAKMDRTTTSADSMGIGLSIGQTGNGTLLIGGSREFVGYDTGTTVEVIQAIAGLAVRAFPDLARVHLLRAFSGLRPFTPDGLPIVGKVDEWPGLFIAAGHEGDGIALGPITGDVMAHLVCNLELPFDVAPFSLSRFSRMKGVDVNGNVGKQPFKVSE